MSYVLIGKANLTEHQIDNLAQVKNPKVKGYAFDADGNLLAETDGEPLTEQETAEILQGAKALPTERQKTQDEIVREELKEKPVWTLQELTQFCKGLL